MVLRSIPTGLLVGGKGEGPWCRCSASVVVGVTREVAVSCDDVVFADLFGEGQTTVGW